MRPRRIFRRLGEVGADQLELPPPRAKQLQLAAAWRHAAGELVARRAPALAIRRGVLDVRVEPCDDWVATLEQMIPALVHRLTAECPSLGIRKVRLVREGTTWDPEDSR